VAFILGINMLINRQWAMPNHNTFSIKPIKELISKYITPNIIIIDPFSRNSPFKHCSITNDLSEDFEADYHLEALDFIRLFNYQSVDLVLFDPPYSPRQISECYQSIGRQVHMKDTQSSFYTERKREVAEKVKVGGLVISFGWNSGGIGKTLGFSIEEILLVAHGGAHNDTICTVERKL
jgi:hypothetical protein